ncbi:unnamed protein product [Linum tenue]|uniref:Uncharacterized protein n=1 Tax=Linum tenue TaxID=586396 RepID=A0AAV0NN12_9ROSI|nr:unnamed protein product [Linum tenue]
MFHVAECDGEDESKEEQVGRRSHDSDLTCWRRFRRVVLFGFCWFQVMEEKVSEVGIYI